jgi:acid stress-induced BolA-like protein IbaG/YrbA
VSIERDVESRIEAAIEGAQVSARGDDHRMEIRVISPAFEGLSRVARQQRVYAAITDLISAGQLHAVTIRALAPAEASS